MGLTVSYTKTPQAQDDTFTMSAADLTMDFDVMANDRGGSAKRLYSLDNGDSTADLLVRDTTAGEERSMKGATIWMSTDGHIAYDASALEAELAKLKEGECFEDSFTYAIQLSNGTISTATAHVRIIGVNDAPVAEGQDISADAGAPVSGTVVATDVDGEALTYSLVAPVDGVTLDANGSFAVAAADGDQAMGAGDARAVVFQYKASDGKADSEAATVTVKINGVNDAPVAEGQSGSTDEDNSFNGTLSASDVDGDRLTYKLVAPVDGVSVNDDGTFSVSPLMADQAMNSGQSRIVEFQYVANDGSVDSDPATVAITINGVTDATRKEILGTPGNDVLSGTGEDEVLIGGAGADTIAGGGGADVFVMSHNGALDTYDWIVDFSKAEGDMLDFRDLISQFTGLSDPSNAFKEGYLSFLPWSTGSQLNVDLNGGAGLGGELGAIALFPTAVLTEFDTAHFIL